MTRFRLCFVANADSVHTRRWVDPFAERGDNVWVIHTAARPSVRPWKGVQLIDLPAMVNIPWVRYAVWTLYAWRAVRRIRPTLLHAHGIDLAGWVTAAVRYHPTVVSVWGSDILLHPNRSRIARRLAHWVLARADVVTAPAQPLFEKAASFAGSDEKIRLIHWGVDCAVFTSQGDTTAVRAALALEPQAPILFCPRRLSPVYNIETVLWALKQVKEVQPATQLLLVDFNPKPDYRRKLDQLARELRLEANVRFLPHIEGQEDMAAIYRMADLVVSLPVSDSLSLTVLEAMACGTPAVVSDLPSYKDWVEEGKTGARVPAQDAASAAQAILRLLEMGPARAEIGQRCREMVCQKASLELQRQSSLKLYEDLLSGK